MKPLVRLLKKLPAVKFLEREADVPSDFWLPSGGLSAFSGALRFFPSQSVEGLSSFSRWNTANGWRAQYGHLAPEWESVGEDALGNQYLLAPDRSEIALFWAESGEVERIEASPTELLEMIADDAENTISLSLYDASVVRHGDLPLSHHFAFRVELILGGEPDVENVMPMDALEHMRALGKIAVQVHDIPAGTPLTPTLEE